MIRNKCDFVILAKSQLGKERDTDAEEKPIQHNSISVNILYRCNNELWVVQLGNQSWTEIP